jgi:hypothetical protein
MPNFPDGWTEYPSAPPVRWLIGRTYPDGTDIQIRVSALPSGQFEVIASAEHRCSGPVDTHVGEFALLDEALAAAVLACEASDRDQLS